jgi:hypothetical protein
MRMGRTSDSSLWILVVGNQNLTEFRLQVTAGAELAMQEADVL